MNLVEILGVLRDRVRYGAAGPHDAALDSVRMYCAFIGYPRSGHTLVAALLDAHRHAVIGHELGALRCLAAGYDRRRLFRMIADRSLGPSDRRWQSGSYGYRVDGEWQDRHDGIHVIGDKQAEGATLRIRARPALLDRLRETVGVPVRFVHVIRNPFDNITTMALRAGNGTPDLRDATERYFRLCETVLGVRERVPADSIIDVRHDDFVASPADRLAELYGYLDLDVEPDRVAACATIVRKSPHFSRFRVEWSQQQRNEVLRRMHDVTYLDGYGFD